MNPNFPSPCSFFNRFSYSSFPWLRSSIIFPDFSFLNIFFPKFCPIMVLIRLPPDSPYADYSYLITKFFWLPFPLTPKIPNFCPSPLFLFDRPCQNETKIINHFLPFLFFFVFPPRRMSYPPLGNFTNKKWVIRPLGIPGFPFFRASKQPLY